uniref:Uncharacterized protein n=1 Tax=Setaria digitata TaxID=48799 RepID=A0A915PLD6_9BILA
MSKKITSRQTSHPPSYCDQASSVRNRSTESRNVAEDSLPATPISHSAVCSSNSPSGRREESTLPVISNIPPTLQNIVRPQATYHLSDYLYPEISIATNSVAVSVRNSNGFRISPMGVFSAPCRLPQRSPDSDLLFDLSASQLSAPPTIQDQSRPVNPVSETLATSDHVNPISEIFAESNVILNGNSPSTSVDPNFIVEVSPSSRSLLPPFGHLPRDSRAVDIECEHQLYLNTTADLSQPENSWARDLQEFFQLSLIRSDNMGPDYVLQSMLALARLGKIHYMSSRKILFRILNIIVDNIRQGRTFDANLIDSVFLASERFQQNAEAAIENELTKNNTLNK